MQFSGKERHKALFYGRPFLTTFCIMMILHVIFQKFYACIFSPAFLCLRVGLNSLSRHFTKVKPCFSTLHTNNFMHYGNQAWMRVEADVKEMIA